MPIPSTVFPDIIQGEYKNISEGDLVSHNILDASILDEIIDDRGEKISEIINPDYGLSKEFAFRFDILSTKILNFMNESIKKNNDIDVEYILNITYQTFCLENFCSLNVGIAENFQTYIKEVYYKGHHTVLFEEPDTLPQGGGAVSILKDGDKIIGVAKIFNFPNEDDDELLCPFYEMFSCIFIKYNIDKHHMNDIFCFPKLQYMECQKGDDIKIIMVFEGATGKSLESICAENLKSAIVSESLENALKAIANSFAIFHHATKNDVLTTLKTTALLKKSYYNSLLSQSDETTSLRSHISQSLLKLQDHIVETENTPNRKMCIIHGDGHVGNIFYDITSNRVTFVDYETAFNSFKKDADPLKDVGCFLGSLWFRIARQDYELEQKFSLADKVRSNFIRQYINNSNWSEFSLSETVEDGIPNDYIMDRIKFYMWARMTYSGELNELNADEVSILKYLFDEDLSCFI